MSDAEEIPEPDRIEGLPHPRHATTLVGQGAAEAGFLEAFRSGRLHHAWLITGPRGVGKATLAWRIARFLLATPEADDGLFGAPPPPETLDIDPDHPVAHRVLALSEPRLFLLRRPYDPKAKRLKQEITVDEARRLKGFFSMSAADGGRRVVIVDAADELNPSAANAVLKLLEEPPERTTLLLISHQPSRLLPTIRSRCRTLRCRPLSEVDMATALAGLGQDLPDDPRPVAILSDGSVGTACQLLTGGGIATYGELVRMMSSAPGMDRSRLLEFCNRVGTRGSDVTAGAVADLLDLLLTRLARAGALGPAEPEAAPGEAAMMARLCPTPWHARRWAQLSQVISGRLRHGIAVNLDPAALLLDTLLKLDAGVGQTPPARP